MNHRLLQFFSYAHLPPRLGEVSKLFAELAETLDEHLPNNAEKTTALRKLLEAKDCAVRAVIFVDEDPKEEESGGLRHVTRVPARFAD